jgi:hypothetical protein
MPIKIFLAEKGNPQKAEEPVKRYAEAVNPKIFGKIILQCTVKKNKS